MKNYFFAIFTFLFILNLNAQKSNEPGGKNFVLKEKLSTLATQSDNKILKLHFNSMLMVINSVEKPSKKENKFLVQLFDILNSDTLKSNPVKWDSYLKRERNLIIAWVSPTDSAVSFSWLKLPANWEPEKEYPLYVQLHGLWEVAGNPIDYLTYPFLQAPSTSTAFEDGYHLSPWGRGNLWYQGISETDIWECIAAFEKLVKIDQKRKYLCGHSMGGFGTWSIASKSSDTWAALGLHSAALHYQFGLLVSENTAKKLEKMPVYFVWGSKEKFLKKKNIELVDLLKKIENKNVTSVTFEGGHDYNDKDVEGMYNWMKQFSKE